VCAPRIAVAAIDCTLSSRPGAGAHLGIERAQPLLHAFERVRNAVLRLLRDGATLRADAAQQVLDFADDVAHIVLELVLRGRATLEQHGINPSGGCRS
jgi:hypothetical protein